MEFPVILEEYDRMAAVFERLTRECPFALHDEWPTDDPIEPADVVLWEKSPNVDLVARRGDCVYRVHARASGTVSVHVRAPSRREAEDTMTFLKEAMPSSKPPADAVPFEFVRLKASGLVERRNRPLQVPSFGEIRDNYSGSTRKALDDLIAKRLHDGMIGRIVLWHGPPGTGKTYMLRALARAWKDKARMVYVVDPENFFGGSTDYIMSVLVDDEDEHEEGRPPWTVVILEDSGEYFSAAPAARLEQGLARLLNFSDGVLGQGLRCIFMLTTNQRIYELHPALTRPGRCLADIRFTPLAPGEVRRWLADKGIRDGPKGERVLAELYSVADKHAPIQGPPSTSSSVEVQ